MTEMICDDVVFHFNKKNLEDPTVPMWVIKARGQTMYVNHVTCSIPWTTKETPDNSHTKGSIKIKRALLKISPENDAEISTATDADIRRIRAQDRGYVRIAWTWGHHAVIGRYLKTQSVRFSTIKNFTERCGSTYYVTDIRSNEEAVAMELALWGTFTRLSVTHPLYVSYDDPSKWHDEEDDDDDDDDPS